MKTIGFVSLFFLLSSDLFAMSGVVTRATGTFATQKIVSCEINITAADKARATVSISLTDADGPIYRPLLNSKMERKLLIPLEWLEYDYAFIAEAKHVPQTEVFEQHRQYLRLKKDSFKYELIYDEWIPDSFIARTSSLICQKRKGQ